MKRTSREINIFSMSALDLFASALGAFMVIAVIFMPFFPNTGDSPERIEDMRVERDEAIGERDSARADADQQRQRADALEEEVARLKGNSKLPPVDVMIVVDTTGSMEYAVSGLKADVTTLASILASLSESASLGIVEFKDRCEGRRAVRDFSLQPVTNTSTGQLQNFVNPMKAGNYTSCNKEQPEAVDLGLRRAVAQKWRADSPKQVIVVVTDNPAEANYIQATYTLARNFAGARDGRSVSTVFVRSKRSLDGTEDFLKQVARNGRGRYAPAGGSFIGTVLLAVLDT